MVNKQIGVGHLEIDAMARMYIKNVLRDNRLSYGEFTRRFEHEFGRLHDVKYAMFCNSGTSALQAGLHALKIKYNYLDGDEVIVPALTFVASVNVILQNNLTPVFVDIEPDYFALNPTLIEQAITPKTRAIMVVHIGGHPADMTRIMALAKKYNLQVIEDSCETMFAHDDNRVVGSFGDVSCFSTYVAHMITTGVGGFACTNDPELAVLIKSLFNHGRDSIYLSIDDDKDKKGKDLFNIVSKRFKFDYVGYSYRATELEAAIGCAQLLTWRKNVEKRQENARKLTEGLKDLHKFLQLPTTREGAEHVFMFYPIVVKGSIRDDLVNYLESHFIETRQLLPLLNQPVYKKLFGGIEANFPVAKQMNEKAFYIASHPGLTEEEINHIIKTFHDYFNKDGGVYDIGA